MKKTSGIRFVTQYTMYRTTVFDVIHDSGRCRSYYFDKDDEVKLPKTVEKFMQEHASREQHDRIFDRDEIIYE